jgi:hypothetical protein
MNGKIDNAFRGWHMTANNYDEFLNQRIHSSLAYQVSQLSAESLALLPSQGLITCIPSVLMDGLVDPPALNLWVVGSYDTGLENVRKKWSLVELRPFETLDEFLKFEQHFLDFELDTEKQWANLDHEGRVVTVISFLGLMKPVELIFGRTSMAQSLQIPRPIH